MKAVILAGGRGTRLMEETKTLPKPMVTIGEEPILMHVIRGLASHGIKEFIICLGYKGDLIKDYFLKYKNTRSDLRVNLLSGDVKVLNDGLALDVSVTLVETGLNTNTAGRVQKIGKYVQNEQFLLTYGDGVSDIDPKEIITLHRKSGAMLTNASKQVASRFGSMEVEKGGKVKNFTEKGSNDARINIGYFICEPEVFDFIEEDSDDVQWENGPVVSIAKTGRMFTYDHTGFWQCMDSLRDKEMLEEMWITQPKWKTW